MRLRLSLLLLSLLFLSAAVYFSFVHGLVYRLPNLPIIHNSRSGSLDLQDPALRLVPHPDDWTDYGPILEAGSEGDWDFSLDGMTTVLLKDKDGTYYFYYGGSDGYRSFDGGPRHRAVGVATSKDGIHYQKYAGNPVMAHLPNQGEEEGANSAAVTFDGVGNFVMYYGGAEGVGGTIHSNGRLAVSEDGFNFIDQGIVMHQWNPFLYGFGDEIFPVSAYQHNGRWNVYYYPNGAIKERTLGMVWGSQANRLFRSTGVLDERSGGKPVFSWGNINWLAPDKIALFIQRLWWPDTFVEVRTASPDAPYRLSEPVERYDIPNLNRGTAFLDTESRTWFMIYNIFDHHWRLKLAPAGEPDTSPPTKPVNLQAKGLEAKVLEAKALEAKALEYDTVSLSWEPASDPDTGVISYRVYRDLVEVGSTLGLGFTEAGLSELRTYTYEVSAVNFHGAEGPREVIEVETPADLTAPYPLRASTGGNPGNLVIRFSEPVDKSIAEDISNYTVTPEIQVLSASLEKDQQTVILETSPHIENQIYTLKLSNIADLAREANNITGASLIQYTHSQSTGLVGRWGLGEGAEELAADLSGFGNVGEIKGPAWEDDQREGAFQFDGVDDYVLIPDGPPLDNLTQGSFTFSAWVLPENRPGGNPYSILTRVGSHPAYYFGLSYDREGKYRAQIITADEVFHVLASKQFSPGAWHHLAMVLDVDSRQMFLYVDGEQVEDSPLSYSGKLMILGVSMGEYYIGSTKPDLGAGAFFTQHFKGLISDAQIYNRALGAQEVYCLANVCPP